MGGNIGLESAVGKGSTFWFTVRLQKSAALRPVLDSHHRLVKVRVLVVDDNTTSRPDSFMSRSSPGKCATAPPPPAPTRSIACGKRREKETPISLAIIDLEMPNMDGLALAREIKSRPEIASTRLILLAGFGKRISPEELRAAGICGLLLQASAAIRALRLPRKRYARRRRLIGVVSEVLRSALPARGRRRGCSLRKTTP